MSSLTQIAFLKALNDKFDPTELVELLDLETVDIIDAFEGLILQRQSSLEDELKYGH